MKTGPERCRRVMISAGEVSGDVHGSYLVRELKKLRPNIKFFGLGSERLAAEGVEIKFDITKRGTIGIFEALPNIFPVFSVFNKAKKLIRQERPDLVILIDSQGFNMPLAKFCKKIGVKVVYYIAPQEWLWGTPKGVKKVAETVDLIVAIFPKEYEAYKAAGAHVVYFGHPLIDIVASRASRVAGQICLCPGSRAQEIKSLFPVLLKAAEIMQKENPETTFVIAAANEGIAAELKKNTSIRILVNQTYDALASSELALCTSGTINLEASILGLPNIMVYKLSPLTYFIGKYILKIDRKIKYFSMPNILLDEKVIPELVMADAEPIKIAETALEYLKNESVRSKLLSKFGRLRQLLGQPGAISRAASSILDIAIII